MLLICGNNPFLDVISIIVVNWPDNGPFPLTVRNAAGKREFPEDTFVIEIYPTGNDTWRFNYYLDLIFTDGGHITHQQSSLSLSQANNFTTSTI
jgi:hypothetical protein